MRIAKLGVVGAGTMGSGIAALAASAGIPVVLLDIPGPDGDRSAPARAGLERARKARPAAFMDVARAGLISLGNLDDSLDLLADCDLILEAIVEQPGPKQTLYARLEPLLKPNAIVASNTSGIPMRVLTEGRSDQFKRHFLGMHFFNPPRYLHLLELIPTSETAPDALDAARRFSEVVLGKGIVLAKDVPGFVANRLGVYGMVAAMKGLIESDLTIDEVDALTGPLLGRAKSATFRTADITGLDVLLHVSKGLSASTGEDFSMPEWVEKLAASGRLGDKSGGGFYKKVGKDITTLDWKTLEYGPQQKVESPELAALMKQPLEQRLKSATNLPGKYGDFVRNYLLRMSHYVLKVAPDISYDLVAVDRALEWGYAWDAGPFKQMDALGHDFLRDGFARLGLDVPPMLAGQKDGTFYRAEDGGWTYFTGTSRYAPVPPVPGQIALDQVRARKGAVIESSRDANILDLGDGVLLLEARSKMNTMGAGVLATLRTALDRVAQGKYEGLVIGNDDPRAYSAGADLGAVVQQVQSSDWKGLDEMVRYFQDGAQLVRRAPFPIVAAPFGLTLGGGAEYALHADRIQAHAELYMGLVEAGVGLIPAGGGTKELLFRFTDVLAPFDEADPFEGVKRAFKVIAMATTSTSALEARALGFLRPVADRITMNRDRLIADAKARVLDLALDYVAPQPRTITALGKEAFGNLLYAGWAMKEGGQITDHEVRIARELAYVLCGGDGPPRVVSEQDVLDLEREAFLRLLGTKETQERIAYTLKTGKPLRN
ncbi:MAG TPA: 3-hydroxyacyl-CoA dehydrogenase/enoyl-CoA hydratase family protein [Gemmatimonadaceae bacterium]|nr:3-hydroxyacyl-CoA dehydrogenase/enoyl-CoA hydratase family protein [Gemmatimonadaceae bacterium]